MNLNSLTWLIIPWGTVSRKNYVQPSLHWLWFQLYSHRMRTQQHWLRFFDRSHRDLENASSPPAYVSRSGAFSKISNKFVHFAEEKNKTCALMLKLDLHVEREEVQWHFGGATSKSDQFGEHDPVENGEHDSPPPGRKWITCPPVKNGEHYLPNCLTYASRPAIARQTTKVRLPYDTSHN